MNEFISFEINKHFQIPQIHANSLGLIQCNVIDAH